MLAGDFNLIRSSVNRNRGSGNHLDMLLFNDLNQHLDLDEIEFRGRDFTWSNMQQDPLLEKLDWVFTSSSWATSYPNTSVKVLSRPVSDHTPFLVAIGTHVPKARLFHFQNYWMDFPDFLSVVQLHWDTTPYFANAARTVNAKFRQIRAGLKHWRNELSKLGKLINNSHFVIAIWTVRRSKGYSTPLKAVSED
jgi:hypothetical protein